MRGQRGLVLQDQRHRQRDIEAATAKGVGFIPVLDRVLQWNPTTFAQIKSRVLNSPQELGVVFQPVLEPVVVGRKADQHARRSPMTSNDDFFLGCLPKVLGQVIFHLRQSDLPPRCPTRASPLGRATIALRPW